MSAFDVYGMTDKLSNSVAEVIVARLEARGKNPRFQAMMQEYLSAMQIDPSGLRCLLQPICPVLLQQLTRSAFIATTRRELQFGSALL